MSDDSETIVVSRLMAYLIGVGIGIWLCYSWFTSRAQLVLVSVESGEILPAGPRGTNHERQPAKAPLPFRRAPAPERATERPAAESVHVETPAPTAGTTTEAREP